MRLISFLIAGVVIAALYFVVIDRDALLSFANRNAPEDPVVAAGQDTTESPSEAEQSATIPVVAWRSKADVVDGTVILRGLTEAARQVELRAETNGQVISEPLRKGARVEKDDLLCRIDPGTREVALDEARAGLGEALSRLPEAKARLAEAQAALPAAEARIAEAKARVPEARARLLEAEANLPASRAQLAQAEAGVPAANAQLSEARARIPEAEARVSEANARLREALILFNAANELKKEGFASQTRVASAEAATESARAGVQSAKSQLEGAKAGVESAISAVQGAKANVESARSQVEGANAAIESAKSQVESALAGVISAESGLEGARAQITSAESGVEGARAGIQSAQTAVAAAEKELDRLEIRAPFGGLLESDAAELGSLLQAGSLCATVIQLDPIKLVGFVPETEVDRVHVGAQATARLSSGREVAGRVTFLSRSADRNTRTFRAEVEVANPDWSIRDGQTAEIVIDSDGALAHLIPQSALTLNDEGRLGVRLVADNETARFAPVSILRDSTDGIWVGGLDDEVSLIVVGQEFVTDGVRLAPTYRENGQ